VLEAGDGRRAGATVDDPVETVDATRHVEHAPVVGQSAGRRRRRLGAVAAQEKEAKRCESGESSMHRPANPPAMAGIPGAGSTHVVAQAKRSIWFPSGSRTHA
jgi:hypothetical protein